jgi:hypothetical protein
LHKFFFRQTSTTLKKTHTTIFLSYYHVIEYPVFILKQRTPQNFDVSWVKQKLHSSQALSHQQPQQRLGWGQGLQGHGFQVVAARIRSDAHLAASKRSAEARKLRGAKTRWRGTGTIWNHGDVSF